MSTEYDNKKIIPNPGDKDTRLYVTFERIRDRLPSTEGKGGKYLKVSGDEEHCEWATGGGGGTGDYNDLDNKPSVNNVTLAGNKTLSDLGIQQEIDKKQNKVFYQETEPLDAVPGDLWCSEGTESISFANIAGNATDNASLAAELAKKVNASGYLKEDYGKKLGISKDGTVIPVASEDLPIASSDGTAAIFYNGEWRAQTGYAYSDDYIYGTKFVITGRAYYDVGWIPFTAFTFGERIKLIKSIFVELDFGYTFNYPKKSLEDYSYFGAPVDKEGNPEFSSEYPVCIRVSQDGSSSWFGLAKEGEWTVAKLWDDFDSMKFDGKLIELNALQSNKLIDGPNLVDAVNSKVPFRQDVADIGKFLGITKGPSEEYAIVSPVDPPHLYIHNLNMTAGNFTLVCQVFSNIPDEMTASSFLQYLSDHGFIEGYEPVKIFPAGGGSELDPRSVYGIIREIGDNITLYFSTDTGISRQDGLLINTCNDTIVEVF